MVNETPAIMNSRSIQISIKYFLDRGRGIPLLLILSVFFVPIALAIKIEDRGPVFFKQKRPGLQGTPFGSGNSGR